MTEFTKYMHIERLNSEEVDGILDGKCYTRTGLMLPYDLVRDLCEESVLDYIPPLAIVTNPNEEDLWKCLEKCGQFLVEDGKGTGEGIVIKNYDFMNKYGRQTWAKIVTNEFKEKHHKEMGAPEINSTSLVEQAIVDDFLTEEFIKKEQAKIMNTHYVIVDGVDTPNWDNRMVPELLGRVWYEFIREETTSFLKEFKNPKINFRLLNTLVIKKTKEVIGL